MKKQLFLLTSILALFLIVDAQAPKEKTLLWEVSGKGIQKPSYLFGTIHLMCPGDLQVPQVIKDKFNTTSSLYLEIDMDDPNMVPEMMAGMQMKDTATLETLIGERFDTINTIFTSTTGLPLKMLASAKPLLIMSMIYPSLLGCTPVSWEGVFGKMAKEKGIPTEGLEKLQDQIDVFDKIPYKVQSEMLVKMLLNLDSAKADFKQMLEVYKKRDIDQLNVLTVEEEDFGDYQEILVNNRNHNWIPVIGEQAKKAPTFFAFGAGHLGGETGVINLLRKAGFAVKPIMY